MQGYWANYDRCLDRVQQEGRTVEDVIRVVNDHFEPSAGEAFFPDGADRTFLGTLMEAPGWRIVWVDADYYFAARDQEGNGLTYVEGDIYRGVERRR